MSTKYDAEALKIAAQLRGKKPGGHFEYYSVISSRDVSVVCGTIFGDSRFRDGTIIHSSRVVELDSENKVLETLNTVFTLGTEVDKDSDPERHSAHCAVLF